MKQVLLVLIIPLLLGMGDGHYALMETGNSLYKEGKYEPAFDAFASANRVKDSAESRFNMASSLYQLERYEEAEELYSSVMNDGSRKQKEQARDAAGETGYFSGKAKKEAGDLKAAKEVLLRAKKNLEDSLKISRSKTKSVYLERTLKLLKELEQKKKEQDKQNKNKENDKDKDKQDKQDENGNDKEKQEKENKEKKQNSKKDDEQKEKNKQQQDNDKQKQKQEKQKNRKPTEAGEKKKNGSRLKPEEVERILEALEDKEKKLQKQMRQGVRQERKLEKDW